MKRRSLAIVLGLTLVIAAGTLVQDYRFDMMLARERAAAAASDREFETLDLAIANLRAAEAGYVAAGQGPQFWMTRATDLATSIEDRVAGLSSSTSTADARTHYDAAINAIGELNNVDTHARDDVNHDQKFEASDLIFTDATQTTQKLSSELDAAQAAERHASDARLAKTSQIRLAMNAGALAFALLVGFVLFRRTKEIVDTDSLESPSSLAPAKMSDLSLRPPTVTTSVPPVTVTPAAEARRDVNLGDAAELCVDLARVIDGRDVPALLERAAAILGAKGVVLWLTDTTGAVLKPSVAFGYPDRVLARMGTLPTEGDNATSLAFRSMRPQVINGGSTGAGAIAVPLVTPTGCVGVLAAEMSRTRPAGDTLAVSRMIAAQFASLVAPVSSAGAGAHAANG